MSLRASNGQRGATEVIPPFTSGSTRRSGRSSSSGSRFSRALYSARQQAQSGFRVDWTKAAETGGGPGSISGIEQGEEKTSTRSCTSFVPSAVEGRCSESAGAPLDFARDGRVEEFSSASG